MTFGVSRRSNSEDSGSRSVSPQAGADLQLFEPKERGSLKCSRGLDGITRCDSSGIASDMAGMRLLLWLQPVDPPSETPGWYLQRPPVNGIRRIETDGTWSANDEANRLLSERGVVLRDSPEGTKVRTATHVVVTFK